MKISAIECPKCESVIYSRARHDFHWCPCENIAIDGGFDYKKVCYKTTGPRHLFVEVDVTRDTLYQDWNYRKDQYGLILKENRQKNLEEFVELK